MPLLDARDLCKSFRGRGQVVHGVSFTVEPGEIVGLLGPNGAGKTTSFRMTVGMIKPDDGTVSFLGNDITRLPMYRRARLGLGYLSQEPSIFRGLTVEQNVMAIVELVESDKGKRQDAVDQLLRELHIDHLRDSPASALSGGERRRVEIARALATRPSYMLLDEPFAGIDPIAIHDIRDLISFLKDRGLGILITDHNVRETLSIVDRAYIMYDGDVLFSGTPQAILARANCRYATLPRSTPPSIVSAPRSRWSG